MDRGRAIYSDEVLAELLDYLKFGDVRIDQVVTQDRLAKVKLDAGIAWEGIHRGELEKVEVSQSDSYCTVCYTDTGREASNADPDMRSELRRTEWCCPSCRSQSSLTALYHVSLSAIFTLGDEGKVEAKLFTCPECGRFYVLPKASIKRPENEMVLTPVFDSAALNGSSASFHMEKKAAGPNSWRSVKLSDILLCSFPHSREEWDSILDCLSEKTKSGNAELANKQDENGMTPLMRSASLGDIAEVQWLLDMGADLKLKDNVGFFALSHALRGACGMYRYMGANSEQCKVAALRLLDAGAPIVEYGDDPTLVMAVRSGDAEIVERVLEKCNNVNVLTSNGTNALMWCDAQKNTEIAEILIDAGIDIEQRTRDGLSALWFAIDENNVGLARLLLANGADPNVASPEGEHALFYAAYKGEREMALLLLDYGADASIPLPSRLKRKYPLPYGVRYTESGLSDIERLGYDGVCSAIVDDGLIDILVAAGCRTGLLRRNGINISWSRALLVR